MREVITLEYHDVVADSDFDGSGFTMAGSASYKLLAADFEAHLEAVARSAGERLAVGGRADDAAPNLAIPVLLTFDDGGRSALDIADRLDRRGWRGHFFMATNFIGSAGFCTADALRELHARGHVVGSHSCSHPLRMGAEPRAALEREWRESLDVLCQLLGTHAPIASVPGGHFTRAVAETAAEAGIRILFTSEPTSRPQLIAGCQVLGRYTLRRDDPASRAASLVNAAPFARARQWTMWNAKKLAKRIAGPAYLKARALLMAPR